jgi:transposase
MNQLRALLLERGIVIAQGRAKLRLCIQALFAEKRRGLSERVLALIGDMVTRWSQLDERIGAFDAEFLAEASRRFAHTNATKWFCSSCQWR